MTAFYESKGYRSTLSCLTELRTVPVGAALSHRAGGAGKTADHRRRSPSSRQWQVTRRTGTVDGQAAGVDH